MKKKFVAFVSMILCMSVFVWSEDMVTGGFILVSPSQEKGKYWKIEGKTAKFLSDNWIELTDVKALFYDQKERAYTVKTTVAQIHKVSNEIRTSEAVHVEREGFIVDAVGLDLDPSQKVMYMHKKVRIELHDLGSEDLL